MGQVADHVSEVIAALSAKPVVVGHSFGGLLAQISAGRGRERRRRGDRPGAVPRRAGAADLDPALGDAGARNPANRKRAVSLTFDQFRYGWANAVSEEEAQRLHETFHVAAPRRAAVPGGVREPQPAHRAKVDTQQPGAGPAAADLRRRPHRPARDHDGAFNKAEPQLQPTEITEIPDRGHALTIDGGWREVAEVSLAFIRRFT